jgi:hypothetical protein
MIYCLNCGKGIPDQSKFCTFCGTAVAANADQPNVTSQTTQPAQQANISSQPSQPSQQYVNPAPPVQQQVQPNPPVQQYVTSQPLTTKNEFYKNAGFWGAVLTLLGFFLPYERVTEASLYYVVTESPEPAVYLYLIFPVVGGLLIIQGLTGIFPRFLVVIFKILPLLLLGLLIVGLYNNDKYDLSNADFETILSYVGVGLYMIVIGSLLMLFFRTTKTKA